MSRNEVPLVLLFLLLLFACANQGNISGGPKDESPPVVIEAKPLNESTHFNARNIKLVFDENIKVENLEQNLLISPLMKEKPKIKIKAREIDIELKEDLKPNTTYTLNFGDAIKDLNEGNPLSGFAYVFSTGDFIDSLSLAGSVIQAGTGQVPEKGLWAVLYKQPSDTAFYTQRPDYITPVLEDGTFQFYNLSEDDYSAFILRDNNSNYYYDLPNEEIAFLDSTFFIDTDLKSIAQPFLLFSPEATKGFVRKIKNDKAQSLLIETSTDVETFDFAFYPDSMDVLLKDVYGDSLRYWLSAQSIIPDSAIVSFKENVVDTTLIQQKNWEQKDSTTKIFIEQTNPFSFHRPVVIQSKRPLFMTDSTQTAILLEDSLFVAGGLKLQRDSLNATRLLVDYNWSYGKYYDIILDDSLFTDIMELPSDSTSTRFKVPTKEELANLIISVKRNESLLEEALVLELLSQEEVLYRKHIPSDVKKLTIRELNPSSYKVRVLIDTNNNGHWDTGDIRQGVQPERVLYFDTPINLRANWDMEVEVPIE